MNRHQRVISIRQKYGLGLLEASKILTAIEIREKINRASSFEELKEVLTKVVCKAYPLENEHIAECIKADLAKDEV